MLFQVLYVLTLSLLTSKASAVCQDVDVSLCYIMLNKLPNICSDLCLAKYCPKSCNICPLECYNCSFVADVSMCNTVSTCATADEICASSESIDEHFREGYKLGCSPKSICSQFTNDERAHFEAGCCTTNRCNSKPPVLLQQPFKNVDTSSSSIGSNATSSIGQTNECSNKDDIICNSLTYHVTDPCSDECIAKLCPKMCKKCFTCLDCYEVKDPSVCSTTTTCGVGQTCYSRKKQGSDNVPVVQLGYMNESLCRMYQSSFSDILGKRDSSSLLSIGCCTGDRCNASPVSMSTIPPTTSTQQTTTTKTTTSLLMTTTSKPVVQTTAPYPTIPDFCKPRYSRTGCRTPFKHVHGGCYLYGTQRQNKTSAELFCREKCGELESFQSNQEIEAVLSYFIDFTNRKIEMLTDMETDGTRWFYRHDQSSVPDAVLTDVMRSTRTRACAVAYMYLDNNKHSGLKPVSCNDMYRPFCRHVENY